MKKIIYFSNNAIVENNLPNPFLIQEIPSILKLFGEFFIISYDGIYCCKSLQNITKIRGITKIEVIKVIFKTFFNRKLFSEILKMGKDKKITLKGLIKLMYFTFNGEKLFSFGKSIYYKEVFDVEEEIYLYSFWLSYDAYAVAKLKKINSKIKTIARAHSYEIQLNRNKYNPYMMKKFILKNMDKIYFISKDSLREFLKYQKYDAKKFRVNYLGTSGYNKDYTERNKKEKLVILSCSSIIPLKQLEWIIEVLSRWNKGFIKWIHIGDGFDGSRIKKFAEEKLKDNKFVEYDFKGKMPNIEVRKNLKNEEIDVFINTSSTEGVPVSIMEAMNAGIPVIAPRINGIPELIDKSCGVLFDLKEGILGLEKALYKFQSLNNIERKEMGVSAFKKWEKDFCLEKNILEIFDER